MKYDYLIAFSFEKGTGTVFVSKETIDEIEKNNKKKK